MKEYKVWAFARSAAPNLPALEEQLADVISGTSIKHRAELNRLMEDCRAGMIDRILVKSA